MNMELLTSIQKYQDIFHFKREDIIVTNPLEVDWYVRFKENKFYLMVQRGVGWIVPASIIDSFYDLEWKRRPIPPQTHCFSVKDWSIAFIEECLEFGYLTRISHVIKEKNGRYVFYNVDSLSRNMTEIKSTQFLSSLLTESELKYWEWHPNVSERGKEE